MDGPQKVTTLFVMPQTKWLPNMETPKGLKGPSALGKSNPPLGFLVFAVKGTRTSICSSPLDQKTHISSSEIDFLQIPSSPGATFQQKELRERRDTYPFPYLNGPSHFQRLPLGPRSKFFHLGFTRWGPAREHSIAIRVANGTR